MKVRSLPHSLRMNSKIRKHVHSLNHSYAKTSKVKGTRASRIYTRKRIVISSPRRRGIVKTQRGHTVQTTCGFISSGILYFKSVFVDARPCADVFMVFVRIFQVENTSDHRE